MRLVSDSTDASALKYPLFHWRASRQWHHIMENIMSKKFRIGFVDEQLDNYHANTYLGHIHNQLAGRNFEVAGCTAMDQDGGRKWAKENDVPWFDTTKEMDGHVDGYVVLAPSSPQIHLPLCEKVLPMGKPTYVDKTFAPDSATAQKIFDLADKHNAPVQTSSALRYSNVQDEVKNSGGIDAVQHMVVWGGGSSFEEYAIHPVELAISCMGADAQKLMRRGTGKYSQLLLDFEGGRTATLNVYVGGTPFAASVTTEDTTKLINVDAPIFVNMASAIMDFMEAGRAVIDREQTLAVMKILDAAKNPKALKKFIEI